MSLRRVFAVISLLITWGCFAIVFNMAIDLQRERCEQFDKLSAEGFALFALGSFGVAIIFFIATFVLAVIAWRSSKKPDIE